MSQCLGRCLGRQLGRCRDDNRDIRSYEGKWVGEVDKAANAEAEDNHCHGSATAVAAISEVKS